MAGHQVTHGCSKVGRVGNSSPSLSDSGYLVDRFTPALNDHSLSHYTLASGCAWGRCEIVAVCHVHRPCVVPLWALKSSCNEVTEWQCSPPAVSSASVLGAAPCFLVPWLRPEAEAVSWSPSFSDVLHSRCWSGPGTFQSALCFGDIHIHIYLRWTGLIIVTHYPLAVCSLNVNCRANAFLAGCSQRGLIAGVL